jgi:hypothetical protein
MDSANDTWAFPQVGFPIRESPDHSLLAAPRGLSQPATPFIGPWRLGIHRVPLVAWPSGYPAPTLPILFSF